MTGLVGRDTERPWKLYLTGTLMQIVYFVGGRLPIQRGTGLSQLRLRFLQVYLFFVLFIIFLSTADFVAFLSIVLCHDVI